MTIYERTPADAGERKAWEPMRVTCMGQVRDVVLGGGGKLSIMTDDPGDNRKPRGQE